MLSILVPWGRFGDCAPYGIGDGETALLEGPLRRGPLVLGVEPNPNISGVDWRELPEHREEGQVELDVNRSFVYYPTGRCM